MSPILKFKQIIITKKKAEQQLLARQFPLAQTKKSFEGKHL